MKKAKIIKNGNVNLKPLKLDYFNELVDDFKIILLKKEIEQLIKEFPNDEELGKEIRKKFKNK